MNVLVLCMYPNPIILLTMNAIKAKVRQKAFIALVSCINVFMLSIYVSTP